MRWRAAVGGQSFCKDDKKYKIKDTHHIFTSRPPSGEEGEGLLGAVSNNNENDGKRSNGGSQGERKKKDKPANI